MMGMYRDDLRSDDLLPDPSTSEVCDDLTYAECLDIIAALDSHIGADLSTTGTGGTDVVITLTEDGVVTAVTAGSRYESDKVIDRWQPR